MQYKKISKLSKGWSSFIWLVRDENGKEYVMKECREKSPRKDLSEREGKMLSLANSVGVGPKVIEVNHKKNFVVMDYVKGERMFKWITSPEFEKEITSEQVYFFIKELYKQLLALDTVSLSHNQLDVGKNILVEKKFDEKTNSIQYYPIIIDFEKASIKIDNHTRNIGQLESMFFYNPHSTMAKKMREKLNLLL
jgi:predicted Ser/Thr protein kinase